MTHPAATKAAHEAFFADHSDVGFALDAALTAYEAARGAEITPSFQKRVRPWMQECFGDAVASDIRERCDRFLEEALELVQSLGWAKKRALTLVEYVYGRDVGEPAQEVGGVMVTLAALCLAASLDMANDGETELARIMRPEIMEKIKRKQAAKRDLHGPLPGYAEITPDADAAPNNGWLPIESAPMQETIVVLYDDGNVVLIEAEENDYTWNPYENCGHGVASPRYFLRLPEPPKQQP